MAATDFDYIDYASAAGVVKRLPVAKGTSCTARPNPESLTPEQMASCVVELPTAPPGYRWQRKNCLIVDGPWVEDKTSGSSLILDDPASTPDTPSEPTSPTSGDGFDNSYSFTRVGTDSSGNSFVTTPAPILL